MKQLSKNISIILLATIFALPNFSFASETDGTIDPTHKYAWSENIGWINFGCDSCNVYITDSGITGYAWSANYGWINLDSPTSGVVNNNEGILSGSAWGENTGWINFSGVTIDSNGYFNGYASGDITGQISFNCSNTNSCGSSDFKVRTDWRPASTRSPSEENNTGGGTTPVIPSTGSGKTDSYLGIGETKSGYVIDNGGTNFLAHINSQINFIIEENNTQHNANIINLDMTTGKVKIELHSDPITIELDIGETKQVDLDNDGQNDLEVKYNELKINRVDLTFTKLSEPTSVILDGNIIRSPNAEGITQFDVYIVKIINNKKFKRLILSPHVFESYGHLDWDDIKLVDQDIMDSFTVSNLVRCVDPENNIDDSKVYSLTANSDAGTKSHLNISAAEFEITYDWDAIYMINAVDRDAYSLRTN